MGDGADGHGKGFHHALQTAIGDLAASEDVETALIAGRDGLLVVGSSGDGETPDLRAALSAAAFGAIDRALLAIELGPARAILVETSTHTMQIIGVAGLLLVVIAKQRANLNHLRDEMARTALVVAELAKVGG